MHRFLTLGAIFLAATFSILPTARAEDIITAYASMNTALQKFNDETIIAPGASDIAQKTHDAILEGAQAHGWQVVKDTPSAIRLSVHARRHVVTIDVRIKEGNVDIVYVDSSNMNYVKHENGQEAIHPKYNKWIKNLLKSARAAVN